MSNYIPHYTKKIEILEKRERTLRHAIKGNLSHEKTVRAVREVREAQFRVIKAKRAQIRPTDFELRDVLLSECTEQETLWRTLTDEEIIEKYRS